MKSISILLSVVPFWVMFAGCGNEEQETREALYESAQNAVRERMKIPKSTVFPKLPNDFKVTSSDGATLAESDSVTFWIMHHAASVAGRYESQNAMGVMLPGTFKVMLTYDTASQKWEPLPAKLGSDEE